MRIPVLACALLMALAPVAAGPGEDAHDDEESGIRSPDLLPGESWSFTFTEARTFDYHCHPHPWMLAGIEVIASTGRAPMTHTIDVIEPEGQDFEAWDWSPSRLSIEAGDTVTWVNKGSVMHVVQETTAEHLEHVGSEGGAKTSDDGHSHAGGSGPGNAAWWIMGTVAAAVGLVMLVRKGSADRARRESAASTHEGPDASPTKEE